MNDLGDTNNRKIVERLFWDPDKLSPDENEDIEAITDKAAGNLAKVALDMRSRGLDPHQVAMFLDRVVFCLFAQSVRLLDGQVFTKIIEKTHRDPRWVSREIFRLFETMKTGGECALEKIRYFNGDLFSDVQPIDLTSFEVEAIYKVSRLNWAEVDASIFGTLFERGVDPKKVAEVGRHYTSRKDIAALVEPVVMAPLRREWGVARGPNSTSGSTRATSVREPRTWRNRRGGIPFGCARPAASSKIFFSGFSRLRYWTRLAVRGTSSMWPFRD